VNTVRKRNHNKTAARQHKRKSEHQTAPCNLVRAPVSVLNNQARVENDTESAENHR
jgi:hypothetical protein